MYSSYSAIKYALVDFLNAAHVADCVAFVFLSGSVFGSARISCCCPESHWSSGILLNWCCILNKLKFVYIYNAKIIFFSSSRKKGLTCPIYACKNPNRFQRNFASYLYCSNLKQQQLLKATIHYHKLLTSRRLDHFYSTKPLGVFFPFR